MFEARRFSLFTTLLIILGVAVFILPGTTRLYGVQDPNGANAQSLDCFALESPDSIPGASLINFDDLPNATVIGDSYRPSFGVRFENSPQTRALIYGNEPGKARSSPNVATNDAVSPNTSSGRLMTIEFDAPKTHVGFYLGNGETSQLTALLGAYDIENTLLCEARFPLVPETHTLFAGFEDPLGRIRKVTIDYGNTTLSESIDDLYFAPRFSPPARQPLPTWTPVPPPLPTPGPAPTPTPLVPMFPYKPVFEIPIVSLANDLSIHGIEISQGIQCFNTAQGLATCSNNSLPVVNKKDTVARIYMRVSGSFASMNNVPVRLYIRANNVWYTANASGKATTAINQANKDSADIYFNVNFNNTVPVDFYAVVDPNNSISETNEGNNRFPASGFITLNFRTRDTLKIVGRRLYYHPSSYTGSQYAGGWAVNGGAAKWFEQMLPVRNNGVQYSIQSGYLNWTKNLSNSDNQHDLIKTLNSQWILQNVLSFWFSGAFTGADHVYGWAPNDGYSGGHADMPVYPHAGGLGVVGIGTDNPGTNTDNPGSGALIFGHELVHDYDIFHTNTSDACGSNDGNSDFPYTSSSIQEFGFNPITGKIYNPSNTHDLMSYCPSGGSQGGWISPFTWNKMFGNVAPGSFEMRTADQPIPQKIYSLSEDGESLVVNLSINNPLLHEGYSGALGDMYRVPTGAAYLLPEGEYAVELRNGGETLARYPFQASFDSEYDAHETQPHSGSDDPPFPPDPTSKADLAFSIPWAPGTTNIVLLHLEQILDIDQVSENPPQVTFTSPSSAVSWPAGTIQTLTWLGLDLDGDDLTYTLFYSHDAGANWQLLDGEIKEQSYPVLVDSMAGGNDVRFRIVATDGVNTDFDETDYPISIPNKAPYVTILNPVSEGHYTPGSLIVLQGSATDLEDGSLPDSALSWSSDRQGGLGVGPSVPLVVLDPGKHVITLTAVDSFGISAKMNVTIYIDYPINMPLINKATQE
jgi:hypothetical protein